MCIGVVGSRLHALVVAAAQGAPVVGIDFGSAKVRWFMEAIGAESALIDLTRQELSTDDVMNGLESWNDEREERMRRAESLAGAAKETLDWIAAALR